MWNVIVFVNLETCRVACLRCLIHNGFNVYNLLQAFIRSVNLHILSHIARGTCLPAMPNNGYTFDQLIAVHI